MRTIRVSFIVALLFSIAACGSYYDPDYIEPRTYSEDSRIISGYISSSPDMSISKAEATGVGCIGEICGLVAYNSDGGTALGTIIGEMNKWYIVVEPGNWMFTFVDEWDEKIGSLYLGEVCAFTIESGDAIDLGEVTIIEGFLSCNADMEELGMRGVRAYMGSGDADGDGIPAEFDDYDERGGMGEDDKEDKKEDKEDEKDDKEDKKGDKEDDKKDKDDKDKKEKD